MTNYGYDYTMGLTIDVVNKMLQSNLANTNLTINYSNKDAQSGVEVTIDAVMEPWQLVTGGSNKLLRFNIPFKSGTISAPPLISANTDISTISVIVEVTMSWLGSGNAIQNQGSGSCNQLVFSPDPNATADTAGYVSCISISDSSNKLSQLALQLLKDIIPDLLYQSKSNLQFVMASLMAEPTGFPSWVKPTSWDYFYIEDSNMNALCFLCMLSNASLPSTPSFDTSVFTSGSNIFLLFGLNTFIKPIDDFMYKYYGYLTGDCWYMTLKENLVTYDGNNGVNLMAYSITDGTTVYPFDSAHFQFDSNGIGFSVQCNGRPANQFPGIPPDSDGTPYPDHDSTTYSYNYSTQRTPSFDNGKQDLFFVENPPAVLSTSHYVTDSDTLFYYNLDRLNDAWNSCYSIVSSNFPAMIDNMVANGLSGMLSVEGNLTSLQNLVELPNNGTKMTINNAGINGVIFIQGSL